VQRYLSGKSIAESRLGLLFNGIFKIPMQFMILFIGAMVFVFYQFHPPPVFFNEAAKNKVYESTYAGELNELEQQHALVFEEKRNRIMEMVSAIRVDDEVAVETARQDIESYRKESNAIRQEVSSLVQKADPNAEVKDTDYVFITFVMNYLPHGIIGLLLAVIFSAAMSSTSSELNALASTTTVDLYKRSFEKKGSERQYLLASKFFTIFWGAIAILFATTASLFENLIEAVNILGSIFYGTILGIFLVAFYFKYIQSNAVFIAAIIAETIVVICFFTTNIGFLWFNVIGCLLVIFISYMLQPIFNRQKRKNNG
jgi:Na+/proline symporter